MYILRYNKSKKIIETRKKKRMCFWGLSTTGFKIKKKELVVEIEYG